MLPPSLVTWITPPDSDPLRRDTLTGVACNDAAKARSSSTRRSTAAPRHHRPRRGDGIGRGEPAQTIEELRPYKDASVSVVLLTFIGPNADAVGEKMAVFMRDVAGRV